MVNDGSANSNTAISTIHVHDATTPTGGTPDLTDASDSGSLHTDNITNVTAPTFAVALNPTVAAGDTVELLLGGSSLSNPVVHTITAAEVAAHSVSLTVTAGDLGLDGNKSIAAKFTDSSGNTSTTSTLVVMLDTSADLSTAATLTVGDTLVNNTEKTTASYTVGGLDPDATALVTVTDGVHTVTHTYAANGSFAFDLTGFNDGAITSSMVITDTAGNTKNVTGASTTLDTSADLGAALALSITDTTINNAEKTAVAFTVSGIDTDVAGAAATVTFSDGTNHVTVLASAGTADLSTLADGPISSVLNVTDDAGNTASANGVSIDLDTSADLGARPGAVDHRHHHQQCREDRGCLHGFRHRHRRRRRGGNGDLLRRHQPRHGAGLGRDRRPVDAR